MLDPIPPLLSSLYPTLESRIPLTSTQVVDLAPSTSFPVFNISTHNSFSSLARDLESYIQLRASPIQLESNDGISPSLVPAYMCLPFTGQVFQILLPKGAHVVKRKLDEEEEEEPTGRTHKKERTEQVEQLVQYKS